MISKECPLQKFTVFTNCRKKNEREYLLGEPRFMAPRTYEKDTLACGHQ